MHVWFRLVLRGGNLNRCFWWLKALLLKGQRFECWSWKPPDDAHESQSKKNETCEGDKEWRSWSQRIMVDVATNH